MKTKRALFGAVLLLVTVSLPMHCQVPSAPLALTVEPTVVMAGTPLFLEVILTNHSDKQMIFSMGSTCGFDLSLHIKVRDSKGNEPPRTRDFRLAEGEDIGREPDGRQLVCVGSVGLRGVMPNDILKNTLDLTRMYDLTQPGKYTVQVSRMDTDQNTFQSNPVEFTVVHNPNYTPESPCTSADVTVTVTDPSGAFVPNALVVFRSEGSSKETPRPQQVTTSVTGLARAQGVACGFVDVFVAADGLTPYAHKTFMGQARVHLDITLHLWPSSP